MIGWMLNCIQELYSEFTSEFGLMNGKYSGLFLTVNL